MTYKLTLSSGGISCYMVVDRIDELTPQVLDNLIRGLEIADEEAAKVNDKLAPEMYFWRGPDWYRDTPFKTKEELS